jgi:hypothetical protein
VIESQAIRLAVSIVAGVGAGALLAWKLRGSCPP